MATKTFKPMLGKRIRATRLDECGEVPASAEADAFIATDGFISLTLSTEIEDGTEIVTRKADGSMCVNEKLSPSFKRFNVELTFCDVNPALLAITTNAEPYAGTGEDILGFTVPEGDIDKRFALELWTGLAGVDCGDEGEASGYALLPFIQAGTLGNIEVTGESAVTFSLTNSYTKGSNKWGVGPYDVVAGGDGSGSPLPTPLDPMDHLLMLFTELAPPPSADDPQPMP